MLRARNRVWKGGYLETYGMRTLQYLEAEDTIALGDFCRPLDLVYEGQSDYLHTSSAYSQSPVNHTRWCQVERAGIDFWIGKKVGDFNAGMLAKHKPHQYTTEYEFVRGELPSTAILPETEKEASARMEGELDAKVFQRGKYKGKSVAQVKELDYLYVEWAQREGIV